jgi:hypothetical protein
MVERNGGADMSDEQMDKQTNISEETSHSQEDRLAKIQTMLSEILLELRQQNRMKIHSDFSYSKLIGAVCQLLVVGLLFWIIIGLADLGEISGPAGTMIKILAAILLQVLALTFFILDRQEK